MLLKAKILVMILLAGLMTVLVGFLTLGSRSDWLKNHQLTDHDSRDDFSCGRS